MSTSTASAPLPRYRSLASRPIPIQHPLPTILDALGLPHEPQWAYLFCRPAGAASRLADQYQVLSTNIVGYHGEQYFLLGRPKTPEELSRDAGFYERD